VCSCGVCSGKHATCGSTFRGYLHQYGSESGPPNITSSAVETAFLDLLTSSFGNKVPLDQVHVTYTATDYKTIGFWGQVGWVRYKLATGLSIVILFTCAGNRRICKTNQLKEVCNVRVDVLAMHVLPLFGAHHVHA
jgi:hypothetical protein